MFAVRRFGGGVAAVGRLGRRRLWRAVLAAVLLAAGCGSAGQEGETGQPPDAGQPPVDGQPPSYGGLAGKEGMFYTSDEFVWYPGLGRLDAPDGVFADVAVGDFSSCGVRDTGRVVCWGEQEIRGAVVRYAPVEGVFTAVEVWRGRDDYDYYLDDHACALRVDGMVVCWGLEIDDVGAAAVAARSEDGHPVRWVLGSGEGPAGSEGFVDLVAGAGGVCGVGAGGSAACWDGQGWTSPALAGGGFSQVVATDPVCGLRADGGFECAGAGPAAELPGGAFADVSLWRGFGCGVRPTGELECWGDNELGTADPPGGQYTQVSVGEDHACALGVGGEAVCWGGNGFGQSDAPEGVFVWVAASWEGSCGLRVGGELACWGWDRPAGRLFSPEGSFTQAIVSGWRVCGVRDDGAVGCWVVHGRELEAPGGEFTQVAAVSGWEVCGLRPDSTAQCWEPFDGSAVAAPEGAFAQIPRSADPGAGCWLRPDGTAQCWHHDRATPTVPDGTFDKLDAGGSCGIAAGTREIACWDSMMTGLVGAAPQSALPLVRVSGGGGWFCGFRPDSSLARCWPHDNRFCGITAAEGVLACWLWDSSTTLQVEGLPGGGGFSDVSVGPSGAGCAIRADRSLACWGDFAGLLGHPSDLGIAPPGGEFSQVEVGSRHACAIGADGAVACWGHAHDGKYWNDSYLYGDDRMPDAG